MDNKNFQITCNIIFCLLTVGLFYLIPYIEWRTTRGDKTDVILGMGIGIIPSGLLLLSFMYGFLAKRVIVPACMASILGIPAIFIPVVAGNTLLERGFSLIIITVMISIIVCVGTVFGKFTCRLLEKFKSSLGTFFPKRN